MTFRQGGILRQMNDGERRAQMDRVQECIAITERKATPEELSKAAALLATRPSARQPELDLTKKA